MWLAEGLGKLPQELETALSAYYQENDLVQQFIEECCICEQGQRVTVNYLYQKFTEYTSNGTRYKPMTRNFFSKVMEQKGFRRKKYNNGTNFLGISLGITGLYEWLD